MSEQQLSEKVRQILASVDAYADEAFEEGKAQAEGRSKDACAAMFFGEQHLELIKVMLSDLIVEAEKTRSQRMREAGFTRRPSWRSLPSDAMDDE